MILKWNNGQKKGIKHSKKGTKHSKVGAYAHMQTTPRYVTVFYISCFVHNLIESNTHRASDRQLIEYLNSGLQYQMYLILYLHLDY